MTGTSPVRAMRVEDNSKFREAIEYLLKNIAPGDLLAAIHHVAQGNPPVSPEVRRVLMDKIRGAPSDEPTSTPTAPAIRLSRREHQILDLFVRGHTYDCVAEALGLAPGTVQSHVKRLYKKLDVSSKAEAVATALRLAWV